MDLLSYSAQHLLVQSALDFSHFFGAFVTATRPKEAPQAIALPSGDDVHVQMGYALADFIVDGYEGPLGIHGCLHSHA